MLQAQARVLDMQRATKALLAWVGDDPGTLDLVMRDTDGEPGGPVRLMFGLLGIAATLATMIGTPEDVMAQLTRSLLALERADETDPGDSA